MANTNPSPSTRFTSSNQPKNKNGRKPSILKKYMKDVGISAADITHINKYIFSLSLDQLKELITDSSQPAIVIALAKAVIKDITSGKLNNIDNLLSKAKINPKDETTESGDGYSSEGGADTSDHSQFHEYSYPESDLIE
jgi:hypothetical protein